MLSGNRGYDGQVPQVGLLEGCRRHRHCHRHCHRQSDISDISDIYGDPAVIESSQVEEAMKVLMAYCSLGEEYQAGYFHENIHHNITRLS